MHLTHARPGDAELWKISEIEVWGNIDAVYMSIWSKTGTTLFIQFLKTLLVLGEILVILNNILTKHLVKTKSHLFEATDFSKPYQLVKLKRSEKFQDEIKSLEESINMMIKLREKILLILRI